MVPEAATSSSRGRLYKKEEDTMPLSRAEAIAVIRREAQRLEALALPLGPYLALYAWAVLMDDAVMDLERRLAGAGVGQLKLWEEKPGA